MSDLSSLIERIEAATEGSRELDVAIILALHPEAGPYSPHCQGDEPIFWNAPYYKQECPHLTASLDAALTLLPEGMSAKLWVHGDESYADVYRLGPYLDGDRKVVFGPFDGQAETAPLALLAAILRARQAADTEGAK